MASKLSGRVQEFIPCECGCGTPIKRWKEYPRIRKDGSVWITLHSERRFVLGHSGKTEKARAATSVRHSGEQNVNWKGGISKERDKLKASLEYKQWAYSVYMRDRFICQLCGCRCKHPEAHHIKPVRDHSDLVLVLANGITLCGPCHELTYGKESEFEAVFTARVANGVNSKEALTDKAEGNFEPSLSGNALEGVTIRGRVYPFDVSHFQKQEVPCDQCGKMLQRHPHRVQPGKNNFCNRTCKGEWQKVGFKGRGSTLMTVHCGTCGVAIQRQPWQVNAYKAQYCTMRCMGKASFLATSKARR